MYARTALANQFLATFFNVTLITQFLGLLYFSSVVDYFVSYFVNLSIHPLIPSNPPPPPPLNTQQLIYNTVNQMMGYDVREGVKVFNDTIAYSTKV